MRAFISLRRILVKILPIFSLLFFSSYSHAKETEIKNKAGKTLKVELMLFDAKTETLHFKSLSNRKQHKIALSTLDDNSKKLVKEWVDAGGGLAESFRIDANVIVSNKKSKIENYDDRHVILSPKATITNLNPGVPSAPIKAVMVTVGKPILNGNQIYIFSKEEKNLDSIDKGESKHLIFKSSELYYDNRNSARYGSRYIGFAFLVVKDGKVIESDLSLPGSLNNQDPNIFLELRARRKYHKDLSDL